ncbi:MAG: methionyl-tRNA formyltransferase [Gammaproteobacteria bacterium]|nr:methionyl-tRNA formyltransferase [Gammaproteobacteria bacterium]
MTRSLAIVFAGTPEFALPALDGIAASRHRLCAVYTQPDRPAGRGQKLAHGPVKRRALELGLPVEQPATLRTPEAVAQLAAYAPDVMVVVAYGLLLPQAALDVPRLACLNIHASLLPRWRGAAPIQRAIQAGDAETGVTIMRMEAGLDTGPMLFSRSVPIGQADTGGLLHDRLASMGGKLIVEALDAIAAGPVAFQPQPADGASYAKKIDKAEARIDWTQPAVVIDRLVRAFDPWPVAETRLAGEQLRIWGGRLAQPGDCAVAQGAAVPGTVLGVSPQAGPGRPVGLCVATGAGVYVIERLQVPGRKPVDTRDFINGRDLAGQALG